MACDASPRTMEGRITDLAIKRSMLHGHRGDKMSVSTTPLPCNTAHTRLSVHDQVNQMGDDPSIKPNKRAKLSFMLAELDDGGQSTEKINGASRSMIKLSQHPEDFHAIAWRAADNAWKEHL